jgi:hypothetical protein
MRRSWIWEHVTEDGHVVNTSPEFGSRERCEAEAVAQGLPLIGGSIKKKANAPAAAKAQLLEDDQRS